MVEELLVRTARWIGSGKSSFWDMGSAFVAGSAPSSEDHFWPGVDFFSTNSTLVDIILKDDVE